MKIAKSTKRLKKLSEIVSPYKFTPKTLIEGSINGKKFVFERGKTYQLSLAEFEVLFNAGYDLTT